MADAVNAGKCTDMKRKSQRKELEQSGRNKRGGGPQAAGGNSYGV